MKRKAEFYRGGHQIERPLPAWFSPCGLVTPNSRKGKANPVEPNHGALGASLVDYETRATREWPLFVKK